MSSIRVFLLGSLAERGPMHGHQLRLLAEKERVALWTDFGVGAVYGALKRLLADELVEAVRTERDGARPERQIVRITAAGRVALDTLRFETLTAFAFRPDPFDLAMARLDPGMLDDLPRLLDARRQEILRRIGIAESGRRRADPYLTVAERHVLRHTSARLAAELDWLDSVLSDLPAIIADERTRKAD